MTSPRAEPSSFRDPANAVFYADGRVLRGLDSKASAEWEVVHATKFFRRALADGRVVGTRKADDAVVAGLGPDTRWTTVLEHDRIPFVSYPYEWSFSMLRDAAILHLELLSEALEEDVTMKDGYAYNVQWQGTAPTFIDTPSFEPAGTGGPWIGYRQFCQTFLFPMMLQAHKGVSFQPFLRGQVNGLTPTQMRDLMSFRDNFRRGVFKNVYLHAVLESRYSDKSTQDTIKKAKKSGFNTEVQKAVIRKLLKLSTKLKWKKANSTWSDYLGICSYSDADADAKKAFVAKAAGSRRRALGWDLGCNEGTYTRIAAEHCDYVVGVDGDDLVIDHLYRSLREDGTTNILPLVMDLTDPSPGIGWRNRERRPFTERAKPDFVMTLALLHHLAIAANIPLTDVVDWLHSFDAEMIVEFVDRPDPMAQRLLANKPPEIHADYDLEHFEKIFTAAFDVREREELPGGTRVMYHATPRV
ncbi:MAG: class I SAM-dependent methyltransferase [Acidimicrobiia bacterium]